MIFGHIWRIDLNFWFLYSCSESYTDCHNYTEKYVHNTISWSMQATGNLVIMLMSVNRMKSHLLAYIVISITFYSFWLLYLKHMFWPRESCCDEAIMGFQVSYFAVLFFFSFCCLCANKEEKRKAFAELPRVSLLKFLFWMGGPPVVLTGLLESQFQRSISSCLGCKLNLVF